MLIFQSVGGMEWNGWNDPAGEPFGVRCFMVYHGVSTFHIMNSGQLKSPTVLKKRVKYRVNMWV